MTDPTARRGMSWRRPAPVDNPLIRGNPLRRAAAIGVVGIAVTASTFLGAGVAGAAGPAVITECTQWVGSSEFGQPIVASPTSLDDKVAQATLLVAPLKVNEARQEFLASGSVPMGTVGEQNKTYSGTALADAFASRVSRLSTLGGSAGAVNWHVHNLALACLGATVPGQHRPAPPPPPPPRPAPSPSQPAPSSAPAQSTPRSSSPTAPSPYTGGYPGYGAPAPVRVVPAGYSYAPGSLPPWAQARFGQVPGFTPDVGSLLQQSEEQQREKAKRDEVQAAGKAEAMPADVTNRVALPVLIAAISIAGVTAALVRTWVLRRS